MSKFVRKRFVEVGGERLAQPTPHRPREGTHRAAEGRGEDAGGVPAAGDGVSSAVPIDIKVACSKCGAEMPPMTAWHGLSERWNMVGTWVDPVPAALHHVQSQRCKGSGYRVFLAGLPDRLARGIEKWAAGTEAH